MRERLPSANGRIGHATLGNPVDPAIASPEPIAESPPVFGAASAELIAASVHPVPKFGGAVPIATGRVPRRVDRVEELLPWRLTEQAEPVGGWTVRSSRAVLVGRVWTPPLLQALRFTTPRIRLPTCIRSR